MPVPSTIADLSATASLNYPQGSESPSTLDDYIRAQGAIIRQVYENGIAGNAATATSATTATTANAGPSSSQFSHRNKIINGKMDIAQRGASFTAPATASYSLDRWQAITSGTGVYTVSQQADTPSSNEFQNSLRVTVTTADTSIATGDLYEVKQQIEGYNVRDLIGKTFTLSFWVRSSKTGIHCCAFRNATGTVDRSYVVEYTVNAANTWEQKSITVSGGVITAGTWNWTNGSGLQVDFALAAGSTFQTTAGAWQTGNFSATANQVNCLDTIGNIFAITGVQLEAGSIATPFEHRPYGTELALCQRYYYRMTASTATSPQTFGVGWAQSTTVASFGGNFPVTMRTVPTALEQSGTASHYLVGQLNSGVVCSSVPTHSTNSTEYYYRFNFTVASGLTAGNGVHGASNSTTSAYLGWSAEL